MTEKNRYAKLDALMNKWHNSDMSPREMDEIRGRRKEDVNIIKPIIEFTKKIIKTRKNNPLNLCDDEGDISYYDNYSMPLSKKTKKKMNRQNIVFTDDDYFGAITDEERAENHRLNQMYVEKAWYEKYQQAVKYYKSLNRQKLGITDINNPLYTEEHHIIPKSFGGSNAKENLVVVSREEHFALHLLLCKAYPCNDGMYSVVMYRLYGNTEQEKIAFRESYDTLVRGDKIDELLRKAIDEGIIEEEFCNINE